MIHVDKSLIVRVVAKMCAALGLTKLGFSRQNGTVTYFLFHRICADRKMGITLPVFNRIVEDICNRFAVIPMDEAATFLTKGGPCKRYAVITFDDGYLDNYTLALPVLKRYAVPATLFACTGFIDSGYSNWDALDSALIRREEEELDLRTFGLGIHPFGELEQRKAVVAKLHAQLKQLPHEAMAGIVSSLTCGAPPGFPRTMMNWQELKQFASTPGITIGAHTLTHPNLTRLHQSVVRDEIQRSKAILEDRLAAEVHHFAYPSGIASPVVIEEVRNAGFRSACLVEDGVNAPGCELYSLARRCVMQDGCIGGDGKYSSTLFAFFASGMRNKLSSALH